MTIQQTIVYDCVIIGGGPAGLNAALILGRARRNILLLDNNKPRNAVTHASHGFITRDGVEPAEFRRIAHEEILRYPSVEIRQAEVTEVNREADVFRLVAEQGDPILARRILLATGLKEIFPSIEGFNDFYGKSVFNCPYCDGWELKDKPLIAISEGPYAFHSAKLIYQWSQDLVMCTNGQSNLTSEQKDILRNRGITVIDEKITAFLGHNGQLEQVKFADGTQIQRAGGFITPDWQQKTQFGKLLGCEVNDLGAYVTDPAGRTNIPGVYAAGDSSYIAPAQLIIAAASGTKAAFALNQDMVEEIW